MSDQLMEARHDVASSAAAIAMVNAHIARALAWPAAGDKIAATRSSLKAALASARAACEDLDRALVRLDIAQE